MVNGQEEEFREEDCKLCLISDRKVVEDDLATGNATNMNVAEMLDMTPKQVYRHMMDHFPRMGKPVDNTDDEGHLPKEIKHLYNKKDIIFNLVIDLKERLDYYFTKDEFESSETAEIVKMADSLRRMIETLSTIEKNMKEESNLVLQNYEDLKEIILDVTCPMCRKDIVAKLEKAEEKNEEEMRAEILDPDKIEVPKAWDVGK